MKVLFFLQCRLESGLKFFYHVESKQWNLQLEIEAVDGS